MSDSQPSFDVPAHADDRVSLNVDRVVDQLCDEFESAWKGDDVPSLGQFLERGANCDRKQLLAELLAIEAFHRRDSLNRPLPGHELRAIHPDLSDEIATLLEAKAESVNSSRLQTKSSRELLPLLGDSAALHIRCPHCSNAVELLADANVDNVECESCGSYFSLVDDPAQNCDGPTLEKFGRFDLLSRLGVGGFGSVWKARDTELDRVVALKIPRKGQLSAREAEQFLREARAAAQLRHPHIVPVFEVGREGDTLFIVSEYVRGVTLSQWMTDGQHSAREIVELCVPLAEALHAAHSEGIVHRDLKPANVMLDLHGRARLMDFGLAKREVGEVTMTVEGQILGTPAYMSPEQARGEGHWTDRRTDIYSMGVMLFQLLTGELPFRGSAHMQMQNRLTMDPPDPRTLNRTIPHDLATICLKCLEPDPNRRFSTAAKLAAELQRFLDGKPIDSRPLSRIDRCWRWARRNPIAALAIALGGVLAVGGPVAAIWIDSQKQEIQRRFEERDALVVEREADRVRLQEQLSSLKQQIRLLAGDQPERVEVAPWRVELTRSLLEERLEAYLEQAAKLPAGPDKVRIHLSLGLLLEQVDRPGDAAEQYRLALQAVQQARVGKPSDAVEIAAAVRAGLRLVEFQQNRQQTEQAASTLVTLDTLIDRLDLSHKAIEQLAVDLAGVGVSADRNRSTSAVLQATDNARQSLREEWPVDVKNLPPLVGRLLDSSP